MPEMQLMQLDNVGSGVAEELFQRELKFLLENIADHNTAASAKRKIIVELTFEPVVPREGGRPREAAVYVGASSKLAPVLAAQSQAFFGRQDGMPVAYTQDVRQETLDLQTPGVAAIEEKQKKKAGSKK